MKKIIKKSPIISGIVILVVVIVIGILLFGGNSSKRETMVIQRSDFVSEVSASGKVVASQAADLGFDQSGRVANVYVKIGDKVKTGAIIANIENSTIRADIAQKQATLEKEQANLASLQRGTRPERLAIYEQEYADKSATLVIAMNNAYLEIESAILNGTDTLFENGNSVNPTIQVNVSSTISKRAIETERLQITEKLEDWKKSLATLTGTPDAIKIRAAKAVSTSAISAVNVFMNNLATITNDLTTGSSGSTQSVIDEQREVVNSAGQDVSTAATAEQTSFTTWSSAYNTLILEKSGSTKEDVAAQSSQVKSSQADLLNAEAQLRKTIITAPFDGIITKLDVKIGEITSPGDSDIAIMSAGTFEVESFIPEINIARIKVSDPAEITLDAYGTSIVFPASIIFIDPAETLRDGVSTYKTRLRFTDQDERIRSGMTANIRITTEKKPGVIVVPRSIIMDRDGAKYVQTIVDDEIVEVQVTTGSSTGLGQTEIISGLNEGDVVVLPPLSESK